MSRPDSNFSPAGDAEIEASELLAALGVEPAGAGADRHEAIARFLANAPDWRETRDRLDGAFAGRSQAGGRSKLSGRKAL